MKKIYTAKINNAIFSPYIFILIFCINVNAQLYNNGPISTGTTAANGTAAPASYTWSETQADTGNTTEANGSFGFSGFYNNALTTDIRLADNFTVPTGQTWNITNFAFFCYQTSYAGTTPPIDVLRLQIFNGDPSAGGTLVAGNMTTNVYDAANSGEALMYRISNTLVPTTGVTGTLRKIWQIRANITASLTDGTYWVVYQGHATNDGSFFMVPVTLPGTRGAPTANAKQFTATTSTWASVIDAGNPAAAPDVMQDMSFIINGVSLSNSQFNKTNDFVIYPNPVNESFQILKPDGTNLNGIELIDNLGRVIKVLIPTNGGTKFDCADLQSGNYFVKIKSENGISIKKFIKN